MECCKEVSTPINLETFRCGACLQTFSSICKLHSHVILHGSNGSYIYSETTRMAIPRFDSVCQYTQTLYAEDVESSLSKRTTKTVNRRSKRNHKSCKLIDDDTDASNDIMKTSTNTDNNLPDRAAILELETSVKRQTPVTDITQDHSILKAASTSVLEDCRETCLDHEHEDVIVRTDPSGGCSRPQAKKIKVLPKKRQKIIEHGSKGDKLFCQVCKSIFARLSQLKRHIKTDHKDISHICRICSVICTSGDDLHDHQRSQHGDMIHQCQLCNKILSNRVMLEGHYLIHKGIKPYSCDKCEPKRYFTRKSQLTSHVQTHSDEKNLQCEFCGKPFNARYLMLNHVKHCGGIKPHKCDFCTMAFVSNHCLQRHRRTHTGEKPYICEVCAFASTSTSCLSRHMRTHTGEKPFVCTYCKHVFAAPGALKRHIRVHTQEKPYQCSHCSKAFTQRWNLKTHERQHTGETPYKCKLCGVGYKQNVLLKSHMKTHFNEHETQDSQQHQQEQTQQPIPQEGQLEECPDQYQQQQINGNSQQQQHLSLSLSLSLSQPQLVTCNVDDLQH